MLCNDDLDYVARIGVGALNGASPLSEKEKNVRDRLIAGLDKILTAKFLAQCVRRPCDEEWFLDLLEMSRDRVIRECPRPKT